MNLHDSTEQQIDDATVRRYFKGAGGGTAATVSMMAHEHNLPASAAGYRLHKEIRTISDWLNAVYDSGRVLDVGCGAGTWTDIFDWDVLLAAKAASHWLRGGIRADPSPEP